VNSAKDQSTSEPWPPEGLAPVEAIKRIADADRWQAYQSAREVCCSILLLVACRRDCTIEEYLELNRYEPTLHAAFDQVLDAWSRGELELCGRRSDPTAPVEPIPASARPHLKWDFDQEIATVRQTGTKFYEIRFRRQAVSPGELATVLTTATELNESSIPSKIWISNCVAKIAGSDRPPKTITDLARQLQEIQKNLPVRPLKLGSIKNLLRNQKLWPVKGA
jgi:hypothetical protein